MEISRAHRTCIYIIILYYIIVYCYIPCILRYCKGRHRVFIIYSLNWKKRTPSPHPIGLMASKCSFPRNPTKYFRSTIKEDTVVLFYYILFFLCTYQITNDAVDGLRLLTRTIYAFYVTIADVNVYTITRIIRIIIVQYNIYI